MISEERIKELAEKAHADCMFEGAVHQYNTVKVTEHILRTVAAESRKEGIEALEGIVWQFAYKNSKGQIHTGGLSALEEAFNILGWDDPHDAPKSMLCDEPGCKSFVSCGFPTVSGYRRTCGQHYHYAEAERLKEQG